MLMIATKSAAALVLGGALLGQQADDQNRKNTNQDPAPPAPTIENQVDREAKDREAKDREAKDREAKDREAKDREAKDREAKDREAKDQQRNDQQRNDQQRNDQQRNDQQRNDQQTQRRDNQAAQQSAERQARDRQQQTYQDRDRVDARNQNSLNQRRDDQGRQQQQGQQTDQRQAGQQGRAALGVNVSDDLTITQVSPGSPAEQMGLRAGDEILSVDGQSFNSVDGFLQTIGSTPQGQQVQIEIDRNGQRMTQSGMLAAWDRVHYGGSIASTGSQYGATQYGAEGYSQGRQTYSAMRYPSDGVVQSAHAGGQFIADPCCDPCAGFGGYGGWGGYGGSGGYGWGGGYDSGWDGGWSRREARRAARRGYYW